MPEIVFCARDNAIVGFGAVDKSNLDQGTWLPATRDVRRMLAFRGGLPERVDVGEALESSVDR